MQCSARQPPSCAEDSMDTFGDDHYVGIKEITMDMKVKLDNITVLSELVAGTAV